MRNDRLYRWELAALTALAAVLLSGVAAEGSRQALAERVVRLHVVAASDTPEDQALKLKVRDAVAARAEGLLAGAGSQEEARRRLAPALAEMEAAARGAVARAGRQDAVTVALAEADFPTRRYGGFALPAGRYLSVQVRIGAAAGQNWWCVVFPPLCAASSSDWAAEAEAAGLSPGQVALIAQDGPEYVLKFKALELWEALRRAVEGA